VIRPLLAYGAAIWHTPSSGSTGDPKGLVVKLRRIQNKCLRTITGAYKATPTAALETETFIPPIDLYLDSRAAAFQVRLNSAQANDTISQARKEIDRRLKLRGVADRTKTQGQQRKEWQERRAKALGAAQDKTRRTLLAWEQR
jgi:hypothetical protein